MRLRLNGKEIQIFESDTSTIVQMFKEDSGLTKLVRTVWGEEYVWERITDKD